MFLRFFDDASLKAPSFAVAYRRIFNVIDTKGYYPRAIGKLIKDQRT